MNNAIHGVEGPSIVYGDGWKLWGRHSTAIPRQAIEAPSELPVEKMELESNLAIRYALLLAIGPQTLAQEPGVTVIEEDECGQLLRRNWFPCPTILNAAQPLKYGGWFGQTGGGCHCSECQIDMDGAIWQGQFAFVPGCDSARWAVARLSEMSGDQDFPVVKTRSENGHTWPPSVR